MTAIQTPELNIEERSPGAFRIRAAAQSLGLADAITVDSDPQAQRQVLSSFSCDAVLAFEILHSHSEIEAKAHSARYAPQARIMENRM